MIRQKRLPIRAVMGDRPTIGSERESIPVAVSMLTRLDDRRRPWFQIRVPFLSRKPCLTSHERSQPRRSNGPELYPCGKCETFQRFHKKPQFRVPRPLSQLPLTLAPLNDFNLDRTVINRRSITHAREPAACRNQSRRF